MHKEGWKMYQFTISYRGGKKRKVDVYAPNAEAARIGTGAMDDELVVPGKLKPSDRKLREFTCSSRIKSKELVGFYETLHGFAAAGASLERAIAVAAYGVNNPYFRGAIGVMWQRLASEGQQPSDAFEEFRDIFGSVAVSMIKAAEASGDFAEVFADLLKWESRRSALNSRITGSLIYPVILILMFIAGCYVVVLRVLPQTRFNYEAVGAEVPLVFEPFVAGSEWLSDHILVAFLPLLLLVLALVFFPKVWGSRLFQKSLTRLSVVGAFIRQSIIVRYLRILTLMMQRGVSVTEAYRLAAESTDNHEFHEYFSAIRGIVETGDDPHIAFMRERDRVPGDEATVLAQKIYTSSFSGNTDQVLTNLAEAMDVELMVRAENLPKAINPIIGLFIMVGVGVLAFVSYFPQLWLIVEALKNN
jgi:type II secretory pathway component PulF